MRKVEGNLTHVSFGGVSLMVTGREFSVDRGLNTAESTAGEDEYDNYIGTTKTITASLKMVMPVMSDGGAAIWAKLEEGTEDDLIYGFEGNSSGKPKEGFRARVVKNNSKSSYKDVAMIDIEWQMAGDSLLFSRRIDTF